MYTVYMLECISALVQSFLENTENKSECTWLI